MGWVALGRCAGGGGRLSSILSLSLTSLASSLIFTFLCILTLAFTLVTLARAEDMYVLHTKLLLYINRFLASRSSCFAIYLYDLKRNLRKKDNNNIIRAMKMTREAKSDCIAVEHSHLIL